MKSYDIVTYHPNDAGACSSNNGNESINRVVKAEDTLRKLLPLSEFLIGSFITSFDESCA